MAPDPGQYSWQKTADSQCGVIAIRAVVAAGMSRSAIRWRLKSGRWQQPMPGVVVTQPEPLTRVQLLWCAIESVGPDAVLGGASAAALDGLRGFDDEYITVLVPTRRRPGPRPGVVIHHSAHVNPTQVYPHHRPRRTRLARSIIDMANWAVRPEDTHIVLTAAVQQRLVTVDELHSTMQNRGPIIRRSLISKVLDSLDRETGNEPTRQDGTLNSARSGLPSSGLMIPTQEYGRSALSSTSTPLASQSDRI